MQNDPLEPHRVLFVCWGNICRSPAAENVFRQLLVAGELEDRITCDSAGTMRKKGGEAPDARMTEAAARRGISMVGAAREVRAEDFLEFDLILVMDEQNLRDVKDLAAGIRAQAKIQLFCEYCTKHGEREVPDPYFGGTEGFEQVMDLIEDGCANLLQHIVALRGNR